MICNTEAAIAIKLCKDNYLALYNICFNLTKHKITTREEVVPFFDIWTNPLFTFSDGSCIEFCVAYEDWGHDDAPNLEVVSFLYFETKEEWIAESMPKTKQELSERRGRDKFVAMMGV